MLGVRWYLRFGLSYRDLEELLAERGIEGDHVTLHRWVQRFTPLLIDAARPCRHAVGSRWFVDETYVKVAGVWRYVYRAVDGVTRTVRSRSTFRSLPPNSAAGHSSSRASSMTSRPGWSRSSSRRPRTERCSRPADWPFGGRWRVQGAETLNRVRQRRCVRSPCGPNTAISSTGPSIAPNQWGSGC